MIEPHTTSLDLLVQEIKDDIAQTSSFTNLSFLPENVLNALRSVPRHFFVPSELQDQAYANIPLPIGFNQTISQPFIVALMTSLLHLKPDDVILEIGTGSGYQTAILSKLVKQVYTVELCEELATQSRHRLKQLGLHNVAFHTGNGAGGWKEHAPYDAIIVTAAASFLPLPLFDQLKPQGTLLLPLEGENSIQYLHLIKKDEAGQIQNTPILPVIFVPLRGGECV